MGVGGVGQPWDTWLAVRVLDRAEALQRWLLEQPLVIAATVNAQSVSVEFTGNEAAQHRLLRTILDAGFEVVEFRGHAESLEDAFMAITKGIVQ